MQFRQSHYILVFTVLCMFDQVIGPPIEWQGPQTTQFERQGRGPNESSWALKFTLLTTGSPELSLWAKSNIVQNLEPARKWMRWPPGRFENSVVTECQLYRLLCLVTAPKFLLLTRKHRLGCCVRLAFRTGWSFFALLYQPYVAVNAYWSRDITLITVSQ